MEAHRRASDLPSLPEQQLVGAVLGHAAGGRLVQAEADAAVGYEASLARGDQDGQATHLMLTGSILIERGRLADAARAFLDAASINREIHDWAALRWCLAGLALAEAMRGHLKTAAAGAAERDQLAKSPMEIWEADLIERGRAWVAAASGELSQASQILAAAAGRAATANLRVAEARLLHDMARLGQPALAAPRLATLAEATDSEFVAAQARHAAALVLGRGHDLEAAAHDLEALGADLLAAEAYLAAAASCRSKGLARQATSAARCAGELAAPLGDVRTPGLSLGGSTGHDQLTRREREIAAMAAAGGSSRDIAARLVLSVRTVDNHLQNVYSKRGVTSRDELARVLRS